MRVAALCALIVVALASANASRAEDIDRPGIGYWCYNPVRTPSREEKISFVDEVSPAAVKAERKWGVPAPILAAMTIVESGYGTTRIAIKSNNILAFKWPGNTIAAGRPKFILWCQPKKDVGNAYPAFDNRADAIDFVASRLKLSVHYEAATATYQHDVKRGRDRKTAAEKWLATIAPRYNWKPVEYIRSVKHMADDPIGDGSRSLWSLEP